MVDCSSEIEAEVVGGGHDAVGGGAGLDGEDAAEYVLLVVARDDVVEDAEDVGLLAEDFLIGVVGEEAAGGDPAL